MTKDGLTAIPHEEGMIVRRWVDGRLVAERGPDYTLPIDGDSRVRYRISDEEYAAAVNLDA